MTDDELKNKITEIVKPVLKKEQISCNEDKACEECWFPCAVERVSRTVADALIAAGIGDIKAAEHRAEVAERALGLCEIAYILALNGKQHEGVSQQAIVSDLGVHKFFIEQAEKELSEVEE